MIIYALNFLLILGISCVIIFMNENEATEKDNENVELSDYEEVLVKTVDEH